MIVPLSYQLWIRSLRELERRVISGLADQEQAVRHLYHLAQLAPVHARPFFETGYSDKQFEKAMRKRGPDALLCDILNDEKCQVTSATEPGLHVATVLLGERSKLAEGRSKDKGRALLLATLKALLNLERSRD